MLTSLDSNQPKGQIIDVAVALTESLIAAKAKENGRKDYKLVGSYVRSSLNWSVAQKERRVGIRLRMRNAVQDTKSSLSVSVFFLMVSRAVITGTSEKAEKYQSIDDLKDSKIGISRIGR